MQSEMTGKIFRGVRLTDVVMWNVLMMRRKVRTDKFWTGKTDFMSRIMSEWELKIKLTGRKTKQAEFLVGRKGLEEEMKVQ